MTIDSSGDDQFLFSIETFMHPLNALLLIFVFLAGCNASDSMKDKAKAGPTTNAKVLAVDSGCMQCHAVGVTVVGPAWQLVAKKYKNDPQAKAFLVNKIKKGGNGNWNEMTGGKSMPAHEDRLSDEEIAILVNYILAL